MLKQSRGTHNEINEGKEEEEDDDANSHVSFPSSQPCFVKTLLFDGHIAGFKVTVVLLVDVAPLDGLLSHGLLHWAVGAFLKPTTIQLRIDAQMCCSYNEESADLEHHVPLLPLSG